MLSASFLLAAALLFQEENTPPQEPTPKPPAREQPRDIPIDPFVEESDFELILGMRAGGWRIGSFDALTSNGRRKINQSMLFDAGIDLRGEYDVATLTLSADYAVGQDLQLILGSVLVGVNLPLSDSLSPMELHLGVGPCFGKLKVDTIGFGEFKASVGFEARVQTLAWVHENLGVEFWADYRQIRFKFDETVLGGRTHTAAASVAFGIGVVLIF